MCLSLLGTWRGGNSQEEWSSKSTLYQLLVSVQSAILGVKYPAFNEPGVEQSAGTPQGDRTARYSDNGGYEPLRVATLQFAMVDVLRQPPPRV